MSRSVAVPGVAVGHWSDPVGRTGCSVVLFPPGTTASGEVRGGSPGTREFALLDPACRVETIDAVVLAGGSAFGLAACDGVVAGLAEAGRGLPTTAGAVPIVVGAVLFDLSVGDPRARPGPEEGRVALEVATEGVPVTGRVGAGSGATLDKLPGRPVRDAGVGYATAVDGTVIVAALVALNAVGELRPPDGAPPRWPASGLAPPPTPGEATTLGVVWTNVSLTKADCLAVARSGHDGLARALEPVHTAYDGDAVVAAATGSHPRVDTEVIRQLAATALEEAVRRAGRRRDPGEHPA